MKEICLAIGCGAIGKSISGYIFSKLGFDVIFADAFEAPVKEMEGGKYSIYVSTKDNVIREDLSGFKAIMTQSEEFNEYILSARVICTSVGPIGLKNVIPQVVSVLRNRDKEKKLQIFLFENDVNAAEYTKEEFKKVFGFIPPFVEIAGTSIERMTQRYESDIPAVLTEPFIPVFANSEDTKDFTYDKEGKYFTRIKDFHSYYYRKLYTNNMGHAVLGYLGLMDNDCEKNTVASISRHRDFLCDCLNESGEMLIKEYGFPREEVEAHLKSLLVRYEGMKDDLYRLTRDPVRKLGNNERIIGVIRKCLKHGIKCESLCKLVKITIDYGVLSNDKEIEDIFKISSYGGILERICGINKDSDEYSYILEHMLER